MGLKSVLVVITLVVESVLDEERVVIVDEVVQIVLIFLLLYDLIVYVLNLIKLCDSCLIVRKGFGLKNLGTTRAYKILNWTNV